PRDVLLVRFDGAAADLDELGVAPEALDDVLAHVAVTAQHLDRPGGDPLAHRGRDELGPVGLHAVALPGEVHPPGDVVHVRAAGPVLGVALGDVALDLPELPDRPSERLALRRVAHHDLDRPAGDAQ